MHKCWWKYIPILEDGIYYSSTFQQFKCQSESDTGVESVGEFCGVHGGINNVPFRSQSLCFISTSSSPNCVGSDGSIARSTNETIRLWTTCVADCECKEVSSFNDTNGMSMCEVRNSECKQKDVSFYFWIKTICKMFTMWMWSRKWWWIKLWYS